MSGRGVSGDEVDGDSLLPTKDSFSALRKASASIGGYTHVDIVW